MSARYELPPKISNFIKESFDARMGGVANSNVAHITRAVSNGELISNWIVGEIGSTLIKDDYSGGNLDNAFGRAPKSLDDLFERCISVVDLNALTKVLERCRGLCVGTSLPSDAIFDGLKWIRNGWAETSYGFFFALKDRRAQRALYDKLIVELRLVRDGPRSGAEHPGCACWREVRRDHGASDKEALHLLIGDDSVAGPTETDQERFDQIHIDYATPCYSTSVTICETGVKSLPHMFQIKTGLGIPDNPFYFMDVHNDVALSNEQHLLPKEAKEKSDVLLREYESNEVMWACRGYAGEAEARKRYDQLAEIRNTYPPMQDRPGYPMPAPGT